MGGSRYTAVSRVHPRTLLGWVRREREAGMAGLADGIARRGYRGSRLNHEEDALLKANVEKSWLDPNQPTQVATIKDVQIAFHKENETRELDCKKLFKVPGRREIVNCIKSIPVFKADVIRLGPDEAMKRHRPVGRGVEVHRPLERVEIDEQKIDLMTRMESWGLAKLFTGEELKMLGLTGETARWVITLAIDCRTKIALGLSLSRSPRVSAALQCLRMVVSDKGDYSDAVGAAMRWDQYSLPELLVADNNPASFKTNRFSEAVNDLDVNFLRTAVRAPNLRGCIERMFGTISGNLMPRMAGRTFSSFIQRGPHAAEARACHGPDEICFALVRWIVDYYHNTPHQGLSGRTPIQQWEADHREGNFPLNPAPDRRAKRLAFGIGRSRKATQEGITVLGVRYHSPSLARYLIKEGPCELNVRWDEEDLGAVEVQIGQEWEEVLAVHSGFDGLNARVWIAARQNLRRMNDARKLWTEDVVRKAIDDIVAMNKRRSLVFGLIDKGMSVEQLQGLEDGLFDGFRCTETQPKTQASNGRGRSIMPHAPVRNGDESLSLPSDGELPSAASRRDHDDEWSFDE
jgi:putative transposase